MVYHKLRSCSRCLDLLLPFFSVFGDLVPLCPDRFVIHYLPTKRQWISESPRALAITPNPTRTSPTVSNCNRSTLHDHFFALSPAHCIRNTTRALNKLFSLRQRTLCTCDLTCTHMNTLAPLKTSLLRPVLPLCTLLRVPVCWVLDSLQTTADWPI